MHPYLLISGYVKMHADPHPASYPVDSVMHPQACIPSVQHPSHQFPSCLRDAHSSMHSLDHPLFWNCPSLLLWCMLWDAFHPFWRLKTIPSSLSIIPVMHTGACIPSYPLHLATPGPNHPFPLMASLPWCMLQHASPPSGNSELSFPSCGVAPTMHA
jgi:hypothetical protein